MSSLTVGIVLLRNAALAVLPDFVHATQHEPDKHRIAQAVISMVFTLIRRPHHDTDFISAH